MTLSRRFRPRRTRAPGRVRYTPRRVPLRTGGAAEDLVSAIGHDLTQPLSTVTGLAELLAQDWAALPDGARRDLAQHIDAGARSLSTRVGHVVVVLDVLAGRAQPGSGEAGSAAPGNAVRGSGERGSAVPVRGSVDAVVAALPATAGVGVCGPSVPAQIDRQHLEHILATLIGDALTYGARPVRVRVVPEPGIVRIEVVDHGRLATRRMRAHALQPSTGRWTLVGREVAESRSLGLAVAARLVAADGGTLWQRPMRRHRGARVLIRLATPVPG